MNNKSYFVYILASVKNGTLYIGMTNGLEKRTLQHKEGVSDSFTKKYKVDKLVHYEIFEKPINAIGREKQLKAWRREWKIALIEKENPGWVDLSKDFD
ncbi:MAG: GIY-YIG nuclease family protein [Patescibacteria group bacterium]|jgi:putative endonuclease|nr:GIY-YIG nuclease family protein [Patescibacteria group bacterium]